MREMVDMIAWEVGHEFDQIASVCLLYDDR